MKIKRIAFNAMLWIAKFFIKEQLSIFDILLWVGVVLYISKIETFGIFNVFVLIALGLGAAIINVVVDTMDYLKE